MSRFRGPDTLWRAPWNRLFAVFLLIMRETLAVLLEFDEKIMNTHNFNYQWFDCDPMA